MFSSFFPNPRLFFPAAVLWTALSVALWYGLARDWGPQLSLGVLVGFPYPPANADGAAVAVETARKQVADLIGANAKELIFTGRRVEAAEARGIARGKVTRKHALRNALVPVVTVIGLQFALLLGGAVLTESTFNWPGLGEKLVYYINNRDYGAVQGIITIFAIVVVLISVLVDIVNALIDPRVRY